MDNDLYSQERMCILGMNFIKQNNGLYLIEGSNNRIVNEKEKLQLENDELVLEDIKCNKCAKDITKKVSKNKKRIKEIEEVETDENIEETESIKD
jgi:hypothetical protein